MNLVLLPELLDLTWLQDHQLPKSEYLKHSENVTGGTEIQPSCATRQVALVAV